MANHKGVESTLQIGGNAVSEVTGWEIQTTGGTVEDSDINDVWQTHKPTDKTWNFSGDLMWDETDTNGQQLIIEGAEVTVNAYPEGNAANSTYYTGNMVVTSRSHAVARNSIQTVRIEALGNGNLTRTTVGA